MEAAENIKGRSSFVENSFFFVQNIKSNIILIAKVEAKLLTFAEDSRIFLVKLLRITIDISDIYRYFMSVTIDNRDLEHFVAQTFSESRSPPDKT